MYQGSGLPQTNGPATGKPVVLSIRNRSMKTVALYLTVRMPPGPMLETNETASKLTIPDKYGSPEVKLPPNTKRGWIRIVGSHPTQFHRLPPGSSNAPGIE